MSTQKSVHSLIVDTGPLIKNTISISTILQSAETVYTTPAIISEIKDAATRSRIETTLLPFLNIRNPTPASYEHVAAFSKKTGDFPVLSRQDLGILALAYEIDQERMKELERVEQEKSQDSSDEKRGLEHSLRTPETSVEEVSKDAAAEDSQDPEAAQPKEPIVPESTMDESEPATNSESASNTLDTQLSNLQVSPAGDQEAGQVQQSSELPEDDDNNDSDGEWITPSNLKKHQAEDSGVSKKQPQGQLSCATMTTDYAMQNVLLQLRLSLISPGMQRIQTLRTYILRCHACFLTTKEMARQFCPRCGQPALNRVSCTTNAKGEFKIHLSKNHQWNNRGNRFSVPKPVGGTASGKGVKGGGKGGWGNDLMLTEDQKEYTRQIGEQKRTKTRDLMDEDYLPSILSGDRNRSGGRPKVGAGKNVNSRKRY